MGINLALALFNLVPAFPMDGGRIFRALLSGWIGRLRATEIAAGLGRALAIAFGAYSLLIGQDLLRVALAAFIFAAAGAELARVRIEEGARGRSFRNPYTDPGPRPERDLWVAPAGYHWVSLGRGVWRLQRPIPVRVNIHEAPR